MPSVPEQICQAFFKLFGTNAEMEAAGVGPGPNLCDQVDENTQCVAQSKSEIAALTDQIAALEQVIVDLDTRVTDLENNLPGTQVITTSIVDENNCHVLVNISDGASPAFLENEDSVATGINVTGGSGLNGNGRIYTLTFAAHPNGAAYFFDGQVFDDSGQPDSGHFEILNQTSTSVTYQINQGDDGGSEDDNDYYPHKVKISGVEQSFVAQVFVNGIPV